MNVTSPAERKHTVKGSSDRRRYEKLSSSLGVGEISICDALLMALLFSGECLGDPWCWYLGAVRYSRVVCV